MPTADLIAASDFCAYHNIEYSFIRSLGENGLVEVTTIEQTGYIPSKELPTLEKIVRLHNELNINLEGIEAITYLLQRVEMMQQEITSLKNRLRMYETFSSYEDI
jgi:hypothetical protein